MTRKCRKTAIYQFQILLISLYLLIPEGSFLYIQQYVTHCLDRDLNDPKTRHYFWQWLHQTETETEKRKEREKKIPSWQFWRAALTWHGQSSQFADFCKIAKMVLFNPCTEFEFFLGPNAYLKLRPSTYPSGLFQKPPTGSFFLFDIFIFNIFFKYETIVRSSVLSFGHSDPDPSSVCWELMVKPKTTSKGFP